MNKMNVNGTKKIRKGRKLDRSQCGVQRSQEAMS